MFIKSATKLIVPVIAAVAIAPALADRGDYRRPAHNGISVLAHELELAARHVAIEAEDRQRYRGAHGRFGWDLVASLQRLERRADRFHFTVENLPRRHWKVDRDFNRLVDAFERARYEVRRQRSPHIRRDFFAVGRLIDKLERRFDRFDTRACDRHRSGPCDDSCDRHRTRRYDRATPRGSVVVGGKARNWRYRVAVDW